MQNEIVIIDYGMGNLRSVQKKFHRNGIQAIITSELDLILGATKLVLPGVGHFANGVKKLKELRIWDILNEKVLKQKTPIMGICLGMQLMANHSEEGNVQGLGWFDANIIKFRISNTFYYKIPHIGWNNILQLKEHPLLKNISQESIFYFVHSYHIECKNKNDILSKTNYEYEFVSSIQNENIIGFQFHPEKSHDQGEQIIKNFIQL
ncbi:imidazole glycerol phosphate synthase subunit HisH [candidate division KSB1 bacterium]